MSSFRIIFYIALFYMESVDQLLSWYSSVLLNHMSNQEYHWEFYIKPDELSSGKICGTAVSFGMLTLSAVFLCGGIFFNRVGILHIVTLLYLGFLVRFSKVCRT